MQGISNTKAHMRFFCINIQCTKQSSVKYIQQLLKFNKMVLLAGFYCFTCAISCFFPLYRKKLLLLVCYRVLCYAASNTRLNMYLNFVIVKNYIFFCFILQFLENKVKFYGLSTKLPYV